MQYLVTATMQFADYTMCVRQSMSKCIYLIVSFGHSWNDQYTNKLYELVTNKRHWCQETFDAFLDHPKISPTIYKYKEKAKERKTEKRQK